MLTAHKRKTEIREIKPRICVRQVSTTFKTKIGQQDVPVKIKVFLLLNNIKEQNKTPGFPRTRFLSFLEFSSYKGFYSSIKPNPHHRATA